NQHRTLRTPGCGRRRGFPFLYAEPRGADAGDLPNARRARGGEGAMKREERLKRINAEMSKRILVLDGSMGAYLQGFGLTNNDFHGERFVEHPRALKGNNDLLVLTRPDVISQVHRAYLDAGVDIIETNTFSATTISQAEYALEEVAYELNVEGARLARALCDR